MDLDSHDLIGQNEGMIMTVSKVDVGPSHHFFDKEIECEMQLNLYDVNYFEKNELNHFSSFIFLFQTLKGKLRPNFGPIFWPSENRETFL